LSKSSTLNGSIFMKRFTSNQSRHSAKFSLRLRSRRKKIYAESDLVSRFLKNRQSDSASTRSALRPSASCGMTPFYMARGGHYA
jgi:hypothetical protein